MPKKITTTPDYRKPTERESVLDAVLLDASWELIPEISYYSSQMILLTQEATRDSVMWLIKDCPYGEQLLKHLKIVVAKKRKKRVILTEAA